MRYLFIFILSLSTAAKANLDSELRKSALSTQNECGNFVRFDTENLFLGFGHYKNGFEEPRSPIPAYFRMVPLNHPDSAVNLNTLDAAIDLITLEGKTYVLTFSGIEEWDLNKKERVANYRTYFYDGAMEYRQHARAFARYQNKLVIAHGRLGLSIFNTQTKRITNQIKLVQNRLPMESQAMSVVVVGKFAYVLLDSFTLVPPENPRQPFRGILVFDMETEKVVREFDGLDTGADSIVSDGQRLIVSFMGMPIWKYDLASLKGTRLPEPMARIIRFTEYGHPYGAPAMDDVNYYTCFRIWPKEPGRGESKNTALTLERSLNEMQ